MGVKISNVFCAVWGHKFERGPKAGQMHCIHCGKVIA